MRFSLAFACHLAATTLANCQSTDSVKSVPKENLYIKSYADNFFLWPVLKQRTLNFELSNPKQIGNSVQFKPNNSYGLGIGMYVFDLGLELVFAVPVAEEKQLVYGETRAQDIQLNILSRKFGADVFYQRYQGFYLANPDAPVTAGGSYPQRPDITSTNFGLSGVYIFNSNKFSLRSAFTFADRQLKSAGSFLVSGTFNSFELTADSAVLNPHYTTRIGLTSSFDAMGYQTVGIAPGYAHNFILKKFFLSLTLGIGPAVHWLRYQDTAGNEYSTSKVNTYADLRVALGYSTDRFFTGITFSNQTRNVQFENIQFGSSSSTFRLLFGWRFREVGFLKKSVWSLLPPWHAK
jgi:hypothetical protein